MLGSETADEVGAAPGRKSGGRAELSTETGIDRQIHGGHRSRNRKALKMRAVVLAVERNKYGSPAC